MPHVAVIDPELLRLAYALVAEGLERLESEGEGEGLLLGEAEDVGDGDAVFDRLGSTCGEGLGGASERAKGRETNLVAKLGGRGVRR